MQWISNMRPDTPKKQIILAVVAVGVALIMLVQIGATQQARSGSVATPPAMTLAEVNAKAGPFATSPVTRDQYPDLYRKLGAARFALASALSPWTVRAAAMSPDCTQIVGAGVLPRAIDKGQLVFFVNCMSPSDSTYVARFYFDEEAASRYRTTLGALRETDAVADLLAPRTVEKSIPGYDAQQGFLRCQSEAEARYPQPRWRAIINNSGYGQPDYDGSVRREGSGLVFDTSTGAHVDVSYACDLDAHSMKVTHFAMR